MSDLSPKKVQDINSLYTSMYKRELTVEQRQLQALNEEINSYYSEEEWKEIYEMTEFMVKWHNALVSEGLIEGRIINEEVLAENVGAGVKWATTAWNAARPVIKQVTGFGTQAQTRTGRALRAVQQLAVPALMGNEQARGALWGAVTGAVKGGYEGAKTKPEASKPEEKPLTLPAGYEVGPDGNPRRKP